MKPPTLTRSRGFCLSWRSLCAVSHRAKIGTIPGHKPVPSPPTRLVILTRDMYNRVKKRKIPGAEHNPACGVKLFEENHKRERFLNAEEVQRLVAAVKAGDNSQLQYIVPLRLLLGCRKRELPNSQWDHFDRPS